MQLPQAPLAQFAKLVSSDAGSQFRIMAIDPGSDTLGLSLLTVDLRNGDIAVHYSSTHTASRQLRYLPEGYEDLHGSMFSRMHCHRHMLTNMMHEFQPHCIIAESAFLKKKFANAFASLTVGLEMIKSAIRDYNRFMVLELIGPSEAKKAVGHKGGKGSDKDGVKACVVNYPGLIWHVDPAELDEHSSDSIAIGMSKALSIRGEYVV